jgi:hypothetical protein
MSIKPLQTQQIIRIQRPGLWVLSFFLIFAMVVTLVWIAFEYGRKMAGYDSADAEAYIQELELQLEQSRAEIIESNRRATMIERNSRIDDDASSQLKKSLAESQVEALELKKELAFYKSIVAPEEGDRSLAIQSVHLKKNDTGAYHYKIMVSQRGRNDVLARGTIEVTIEGVEKGQPKVFELSELSENTKKPMKFGFKYFQNFEGELTLPEAFQADFIRVQVKPKTSKIKALDEQFAWSDLAAGGT